MSITIPMIFMPIPALAYELTTIQINRTTNIVKRIQKIVVKRERDSITSHTVLLGLSPKCSRQDDSMKACVRV